VVAVVLRCIDTPKGYPKSQELQRVSSASCAKCTVEQWQQGHFTGRVTASILIDTFAFIPIYSTLLAICCLWQALCLADEQLRRVARLFAWGGWIAGAFDLLENGGMLLELRGNYGLAPLTVAFSSVKWTIATIVEIFIIAVFLRRRSLFGEHGVEGDHHRR
jgi:hypothetical protein